MKLSPPRRNSTTSLEPLESRIAPARLIITGVPNTLPGNDVDYTDTDPQDQFFVNTEHGDLISASVGGGALGVADTFYLRLSKGDILQVYNTTNGPENFLQVKSGNVVAFFVDKNGNNEVQDGELVSIALGKNASIILRSGIEGDIVTALDEHGTKSLTDDTLTFAAPGGVGGLVSAKNGIKGLSIGGGAVAGAIMAGGNISNVVVNGTVGAILAGGAADTRAVDFFPSVIGSGEATISFLPGDGVKGSSIKNIIIDGIGNGDGINQPGELVAAGQGGAGAKGGSLSFIQVTEDDDGTVLHAGRGGDSNANKSKGGAGGAVSRIYIAADDFGDTTNNSLVEVRAGNGGNSATSTGGKGGKIDTVLVGFRLLGQQAFSAASLLADNVTVGGGFGGNGKVAGSGGGVSGVNILTITPDTPIIVGDEIQVVAGSGGDGFPFGGGKTGTGGSVQHVTVRDQILADGPGILVQAGNGFTLGGANDATGAKGGSVNDVTLLGANLTVLAGNGATGRTGGVGGSMSAISVEVSQGVFARSATFNAGIGGNGLAAKGGKGGNIQGIRIDDGDFRLLNINAGMAANGGTSGKGKGASGGRVAGLDIFEGSKGTTFDPLIPTVFQLRAGAGGGGTSGGGKGGGLSNSTVVAVGLNISIQAGPGGNVAGTNAHGNGGGGGSIQTFDVQGDGDVLGTPVVAAILSGTGGNGAGSGASGGAGGNIENSSIRVEGAVSVKAANGGDGTTGAAGRGGSILNTGAFARVSSGELLAGNGGANGLKPGKGGDVAGNSSRLTTLYSSTFLTIHAGDGTHGGAGGSIRFTGFGSTSATLVPTPTGDIFVSAGNGSIEGNLSGAGGSIDNLSGAVSSGIGRTTEISAGEGKGSGKGGSITNLIIERGGSINGVFTIEAGSGDAFNPGETGGKGGDVRNVSVTGVDPVTIFRHVAAGDGGNGGRTSGNGGSIDNVNVLGLDIGVRSGLDFGFDSMGGVFAGAGGSGFRPGKAGSVTRVTADSIAAIVAGRGLVPQEVTRVDQVYLNGINPLKASNGGVIFNFPNSTFSLNFDTMMLAGLDPELPGTDTDPTDTLPNDLEDILNAQPEIIAAGGVKVTGVSSTGYAITFNNNGDQLPFTGEETFPLDSLELVPGSLVLPVTEDVVGDNSPPTREVESFAIEPTEFFTLSFRPDTFSAYDTTPAIAPTATAQDVADALNMLPSITTVGGVTVQKDNFNNRFVVLFNTPADVDSILANSVRKEVQRVDFYATGEFELSFGGFTTTPRLPFDATPQQVQDALNMLPTIPAGGVIVAAGPNGAYDVTFQALGDENPIFGTQYSGIVISTTDGSPATPEVVAVVVPERILYNPAAIATANFIGGIADPLSLTGPKPFRFINLNGTSTFDLGDQPIDGLIVAKKMDQATMNVTPEARLIDGNFYDFNNLL